MPRGKSGKSGKHSKESKQINPMMQDLLSKVMGSVCEVKKLETCTRDNINGIVDGSSKKEDLLSEIVAEISSLYRIDYNLTPVTTIIDTLKFIDKQKSMTLPDYSKNTVNRVVVVSGTHELFYSDQLSILPITQGVFVPQGSCFMTSPSHGNFKYDNKTTYDKGKYPGRGFKRPEYRKLLVIDFVGSPRPDGPVDPVDPVGPAAPATLSEDDMKKLMSQATEAAKSISRPGASSTPGLITNLLKSLGL